MKKGHNKPPVNEGIAEKELRAFITRIEKLTEEKAGIADDIREVFAEAKGNGFDARTIREVLKLRKLDAAEFAEREHLRNLYGTAVGLSMIEEGLV